MGDHQRPLILHVIDSLTVGGAEILLANTIRLLPEFQHTVVYLHAPDTIRSHFSESVEIICLGHQNWKTLISSVRALRKIVRERHPSIVHAHLQKSTWICRLAVWGTRLISTIHSTYSIDAFAKSKKALLIERWTANRQQAVIGISHYVLNDYTQHVPFAGQKFVLYNFLPAMFFKDLETSPGSSMCRMVAVGNLKSAKNYHYLLDIMKNVSSATLDIYGSGPMEAELKERVINEKLSVRLCGTDLDFPSIRNQYDLFIQASSHEGFGLSVAEAVALRMPVVISDIEVFREITSGNAHFFPLNNVKAAAEVVQKIVDDSDMRTLYIDKCYEHIRILCSAENYRNRLTSIYKEVISI